MNVVPLVSHGTGTDGEARLRLAPRRLAGRGMAWKGTARTKGWSR